MTAGKKNKTPTRLLYLFYAILFVSHTAFNLWLSSGGRTDIETKVTYIGTGIVVVIILATVIAFIHLEDRGKI